MLNLLIAIMSSTYERVSDAQQPTLRTERAKLVLNAYGISYFATLLYNLFIRRRCGVSEHRYDAVFFYSRVSDTKQKKAWAGHLHGMKSFMREVTESQQKVILSEIQ